MIRSRSFWLATISLALATLMLMDIPKHLLDWQAEVRGQIITVAQNTYQFNRQQKAGILDHIFERNQSIITAIACKGLAGIILIVVSIYIFRKHSSRFNANRLKTGLATTVVVVLLVAIKVTFVSFYKYGTEVTYLSIPENQLSLKELYNTKFKGKVVYLDFWGTTCPPCLEEFTYFTKPLKKRFKSRNDIVFLYICQGNKYLWKQQIHNYDITGYHLFVSPSQYDQLYRNAVNDKNSQVFMPRYVVIDKLGRFVANQIKDPSSTDTLYRQLDNYLK